MSGTVRAWVATANNPHESKSVLGKYSDAVLAEVDIEKLRGSFKKLSNDIQGLFAGTDQSNDGCRLKQIAIGVEISAEGGLTLIGSVTAGGKAAITLTFERS